MPAAELLAAFAEVDCALESLIGLAGRAATNADVEGGGDAGGTGSVVNVFEIAHPL